MQTMKRKCVGVSLGPNELKIARREAAEIGASVSQIVRIALYEYAAAHPVREENGGQEK